jgi:predicted  nucleic acid-binding Zn-ribbon protein
MARWQRRVEQLSAEMSATTDHRELDRLGRDAAEAQARLGSVEDEWLGLAERSGT